MNPKSMNKIKQSVEKIIDIFRKSDLELALNGDSIKIKARTKGSAVKFEVTSDGQSSSGVSLPVVKDDEVHEVVVPRKNPLPPRTFEQPVGDRKSVPQECRKKPSGKDRQEGSPSKGRGPKHRI